MLHILNHQCPSYSNLGFVPENSPELSPARREEALTAEVGGAMAAAAIGSGSKAAAALAANDAYEGALDQVLALGWAHVDSSSFDAFVAELKSAPPSTAAALQVRLQLAKLLLIADHRTISD